MIVLIIVSVMAVFSFPSLCNMASSTNDTVLQSQLMHILRLAKNVAREKHIPVSICKSKSMQQCDGDWSDGLLAFLDRKENGEVSNQADILSIVQIANSKGKLYWRAFPKAHLYLRFLPKQYVSADNGMFWYCRERSQLPAFAIIISDSAMLRALLPDKHGEIRNSRGKLMTCATSNR